MLVKKTNKGVVRVRYQDDDYLDGTATVELTPLRDGEGMVIRVKKPLQLQAREIILSDYDALAVRAALAVAEVPPPRK